MDRRPWPLALAVLLGAALIAAAIYWRPCCCGLSGAASLVPGGALARPGAVPGDPEPDIAALDRMLGQALRGAPPPAAVIIVEPPDPPTPYNRPRREGQAVAEPPVGGLFAVAAVAVALLRRR